jgi:hypothetical protein
VARGLAGGGKYCSGGALAFEQGSMGAFIETSTFSLNAVDGCTVLVTGGAFFVYHGGEVILGPEVLFLENTVSSMLAETVLGGAVALFLPTAFLTALNHTQFINNSAEGIAAAGGALSIVDGAAGASIRGAVFEGNSVRSRGRICRGGAAHIEAGEVCFEDCIVRRNYAQITGTGTGATGGGVSSEQLGKVILLRTTFVDNQAGGVGLFESTGAFANVAAENRAARAAHVASAGRTVLERCWLTTTTPNIPISNRLPNGAPWLLVARESGTITLTDCDVQGSPSSAEGLVSLIGSRSQIIIRGCNIHGMAEPVALNAAASDVSPSNLAIVASHFDPPLSLNAAAKALGPPDCGRIVAGQPMCDPRATCTVAATGGAECSCDAKGLRPTVGGRQDGSVCTEAHSLASSLISDQLYVTLSKPGDIDSIKLQMKARGETQLNVTVSASVSLYDYAGQLRRRISTDIDMLQEVGLVAFGQAVLWETDTPQALWTAFLDKQSFRYEDSRVFTFRVGLTCNLSVTEDCPADGDTIETSISLKTPQAELTSNVALTVSVRGLISCEHTRAWVDDSSLPIRIRVLAFDVDRMSINFTRGQFEVLWDNSLLSLRPEGTRGSNEYAMEIPQSVTTGDGAHTIVIRASEAWSSAAGRSETCELMRRNVSVTNCKAGSFSSGTACLPCEPGYVQPEQGRSTCTACAAGSFQVRAI